MVPQLNEMFGDTHISSTAMHSLSWNRQGAVLAGVRVGQGCEPRGVE